MNGTPLASVCKPSFQSFLIYTIPRTRCFENLCKYLGEQGFSAKYLHHIRVFTRSMAGAVAYGFHTRSHYTAALRAGLCDNNEAWRF